MTINLAGAAIKDVRVAGAQAQKVMLGTGASAVEVWSAGPPYYAAFNSGALYANSGSRGGQFSPVGAGVTAAPIGVNVAANAYMNYVHSGPTPEGITLAGWIKCTGTSSNAVAAWGTNYPSADHYLWLYHNTTSSVRSLTIHLSGNQSVRTPVGSAPTGTWLHVAGRYQQAGTDRNLRVYINGQLEAEATEPGSPLDMDGKPVWFGGREGNANWVGTIDKWRAWDKPIDPAEIAAIYNAEKTQHP